MRIELVLLAGGLAIGWPLSSAINALQNYQWGWGIIFLAMVAVFGFLTYRFARRNT